MTELSADELLYRATRQVLETMFFTEVMGEAEPAEAPAPPCLNVRVSFHGTPSGDLRLRVSEAAARAIAANFLGAEEESALTAGQVQDVICELTNMICGSILSRLESDAAFEIHHPELVGPEPGPENGASQTRSFELENGSLTAAVSFHAR